MLRRLAFFAQLSRRVSLRGLLTSAELAAGLEARVGLLALVVVLLTTEPAQRVCLVVSFSLSLSSTSYTLQTNESEQPRRANHLPYFL